MHRYVDRDKFMQELECDKYGFTDCAKVGIALDKAKADVAEVVRCKDCTEWDEKEKECSHYYGFRENNYCCFGVRREGNETQV